MRAMGVDVSRQLPAPRTLINPASRAARPAGGAPRGTKGRGEGTPRTRASIEFEFNCSAVRSAVEAKGECGSDRLEDTSSVRQSTIADILI